MKKINCKRTNQSVHLKIDTHNVPSGIYPYAEFNSNQTKSTHFTTRLNCILDSELQFSHHLLNSTSEG